MIRQYFLSALTDIFSFTISLVSFLPWFPAILSLGLSKPGLNTTVHLAGLQLTNISMVVLLFLKRTIQLPRRHFIGLPGISRFQSVVTQLFPLVDVLKLLSRFSSCEESHHEHFHLAGFLSFLVSPHPLGLCHWWRNWGPVLQDTPVMNDLLK